VRACERSRYGGWGWHFRFRSTQAMDGASIGSWGIYGRGCSHLAESRFAAGVSPSTFIWQVVPESSGTSRSSVGAMTKGSPIPRSLCLCHRAAVHLVAHCSNPGGILLIKRQMMYAFAGNSHVAHYHWIRPVERVLIAHMDPEVGSGMARNRREVLVVMKTPCTSEPGWSRLQRNMEPNS
jgi:hypothetical protein